MTKYALNLLLNLTRNSPPATRNPNYLLFIFLWMASYSNLDAQAQILLPRTSIDIFKTDYLLNPQHDFNPEFIRLYEIWSIKLSSEDDMAEDSNVKLFTQYNFNPSGMVAEKIYYQKTDLELTALSEQIFFYGEEGELLRIEDYYEGKSDKVTHYTYVGDLLDKVHEEDAEGATEDWRQYHWKGRQIAREVTYNANKIKQVEYHLPTTTLPRKLDTLYQVEMRELANKSVYFYLYANKQIAREVWHEPRESYEVKRNYDRSGKLINIKQTGGRMSAITFKYDKGKLKSIKEKHPKQPSMQRQYTYDENGVFITGVVVKRGKDVLENLVYEYEFW